MSTLSSAFRILGGLNLVGQPHCGTLATLPGMLPVLWAASSKGNTASSTELN
jgi:hypothetical protein